VIISIEAAYNPNSSIPRSFNEARSAYSEDVLMRNAALPEESLSGTSGFPVDANLPINGLRPGAKTFQLRTWVREQLVSSDSNLSYWHCDIEIQHFRALLFQDEEYFYNSVEMMHVQSGLLDQKAWRALPELDALIDLPSIDSVPTLNNGVVSYTVAFSATVALD